MPFFPGARGRVHYRTWVVDQPRAVLVFLPGIGQQSADYHRFARALRARDIETWAIDHIGHGLSEGPPGVRAPLADLGSDALHLIRLAHAARPGPVALMGHSLGAAVAVAAMASTAAQTQQVAAVVLCGTPRSVAESGAGQPAVPTLVLHGVDDRRAPIDPVRAWAAAPGVRLREFADAGHDLLHEPVRDTVTVVVADFVLAAANAESTPPHTHAAPRR